MAEAADGVLTEQIQYYRERAQEYDDAYTRTGQFDRGEATNSEWLSDLDALARELERADLGPEILELAAGTGYWTERLVPRCRSVTAVDASAEVLDLNRQRLGSAVERVEYIVADLFDWQPARTWDSCIACFWLCHVPDELLDNFAALVASVLGEGGTLFIADKAALRPGGADDVDAIGQRGQVQRRRLSDGRTFNIIDQPRPPAVIRAAFAAVGIDVDIHTIGARFCAIHGRRR